MGDVKNKFCKMSIHKMRAVFLLCLLLFTQQIFSQKINISFFALHNIIRGDSVYNTFDKQVELIKSLGFDGIEINQIESFAGMKMALDKFQFSGAFFYVKITLNEPIDNRIEKAIEQLKGSKTIIAPYIIVNPKNKNISKQEGDIQVIQMMQQISDWAEKSNLQVAMYPHFGLYLAKTDHALALVKQINRKNVGLSFNLSHWLASSDSMERTTIKSHVKDLMPYLKMITVNGANNVITQKKTIWDDYILPLGEGSFDTFALVKYILKNLHYQNPIGVQCYNIKGDKPTLARNTMGVWKKYQMQLEQAGYK